MTADENAPCPRCGKVHGPPLDMEKDVIIPAAQALSDDIDARAMAYILSQLEVRHEVAHYPDDRWRRDGVKWSKVYR